MNLAEIEERVHAVDINRGFDLVYELLMAYGFPKASIARLRNGSHNRSNRESECLWKGKLFYRFIRRDDDLHALIDEAATEPRILRERPRFLVVSNGVRLVAIDTRTGSTLDTSLGDLPNHFEFFLPWAGIEKAQLETLSYADIKAAERMARLYDEIIRHNEIRTDEDVHSLNVFFSRLLFCFFAEDTRVFEPGQFTNALASLTNVDGSDVHIFLDDLFAVLNTEPSSRAATPARLRGFGYVNGNLFDQRAAAPTFSAKARRIVLECGTLDWSRINPDIFGSMIQAVVHPGQREGLGMHYTSVENIMKVIRPLFLDELHTAFEAAADNAAKLERLLQRIYAIKVFDPACGSGNFLVIAYKELRRLEHQTLQRIHDLEPARRGLFNLSGVKLEHFYGIEIDDFAHEIAILSLWLAKHQMNVEFRELFGVEIALIPLKDSGNVVCGNAARLDWDEVVPLAQDEEIYVLGNPPYQGGTKQSSLQKQDLALAFNDPTVNRYLDYVSIWLFKGARFVMQHNSQLGFLTTNSICQGSHPGLLWPRLKATGAEIAFAHAPFKWSNSAKGNAGVICIVIGFAPPGTRRLKPYYESGRVRMVASINSYLSPEAPEITVMAAEMSLSGLPPMVFGSMPRDGGHLLLGPVERAALLRDAPQAAKFIRSFMGAAEFIRGISRYCLWIADSDLAEAERIPEIRRRLSMVTASRLGSKAESTRKFAARPHRFVQCAHRDTSSIIVPRVSSERRQYIPMGFLDQATVISDAANAIYDATPWIFGLIQSRMHMVWVRAVAGRMKADYRYSAELVYNTFPVPPLDAKDREQLSAATLAILGARELYSDLTLADLYDPIKMPDPLRRAHAALDRTVDLLYQATFTSDEDRLGVLFERYQATTRAAQGVPTSAKPD